MDDCIKPQPWTFHIQTSEPPIITYTLNLQWCCFIMEPTHNSLGILHCKPLISLEISCYILWTLCSIICHMSYILHIFSQHCLDSIALQENRSYLSSSLIFLPSLIAYLKITRWPKCPFIIYCHIWYLTHHTVSWLFKIHYWKKKEVGKMAK